MLYLVVMRRGARINTVEGSARL